MDIKYKGKLAVCTSSAPRRQRVFGPRTGQHPLYPYVHGPHGGVLSACGAGRASSHGEGAQKKSGRSRCQSGAGAVCDKLRLAEQRQLPVGLLFQPQGGELFHHSVHPDQVSGGLPGGHGSGPYRRQLLR